MTQPFAIPSMLLLIASLPLILGLIPRNPFYGVRTLKTLSNDRIWYPVNRFAGAALITASCIYGLVAIIVPYNQLATDNSMQWGIHLAAFVLPILVALSLAIRYAKRL